MSLLWRVTECVFCQAAGRYCTSRFACVWAGVFVRACEIHACVSTVVTHEYDSSVVECSSFHRARVRCQLRAGVSKHRCPDCYGLHLLHQTGIWLQERSFCSKKYLTGVILTWKVRLGNVSEANMGLAATSVISFCSVTSLMTARALVLTELLGPLRTFLSISFVCFSSPVALGCKKKRLCLQV